MEQSLQGSVWKLPTSSEGHKTGEMKQSQSAVGTALSWKRDGLVFSTSKCYAMSLGVGFQITTSAVFQFFLSVPGCISC